MMTDEVREDILTTSENVIADAQRITDLERRKQDPNVTVEELEKLSDEVQSAAHDLTQKATVEKRLVGVASAQSRLRDSAQRRPGG